MIISITKIELKSYSKLVAFFKFNAQIISELKQSNCKKYKVTNNWNLKHWYTMTLWFSEEEINAFYRHGTHLEAMKQSKLFSSKIQSKRINRGELISWNEAKMLFDIK
ncbi:MAG: DUF3291 domain-containing protein [Bacteroidetes bacterium]|nr:DUF3291 domain-containing protein [Bacteroidota bacterium]